MKVRDPTIEDLASVASDRGPALRIIVFPVSASLAPQVAIPGPCCGAFRLLASQYSLYRWSIRGALMQINNLAFLSAYA